MPKLKMSSLENGNAKPNSKIFKEAKDDKLIQSNCDQSTKEVELLMDVKMETYEYNSDDNELGCPPLIFQKEETILGKTDFMKKESGSTLSFVKVEMSQDVESRECNWMSQCSGLSSADAVNDEHSVFEEWEEPTLNYGDIDSIDSDLDDWEEDNFLTESEHDSNTECSDDEDNIDKHCTDYGNQRDHINSYSGENTSVAGKDNTCYGKNNFVWSKEKPSANVDQFKNNVGIPSLRDLPKQLGDEPGIENVWNQLFSQDMIELIVTWTNSNISKARSKYKCTSNSILRDTDDTEIRGFLGLLIYTAVFKSGNENLENFFTADGTGRDVFRCTMPRGRFEFLLTCLRFDNPLTRQERKKNDPSAAISEIFYRFIQNSQDCYNLGSSTYIDEILVPFRGKCSFKMYVPKKFARYGMNIRCLRDGTSKYIFNAYIYTGKSSNGKTLSSNENHLKTQTQSVLRLSKPIENTYRNVTADSYFSSMQLVQELKRRGLTYVGTLKRSQEEIPQQFVPNNTGEMNSVLYGFHEYITLVSYVSNKNEKPLLLISSLHHQRHNDSSSIEPEIIDYYNLIKGDGANMDQDCENYTASRRTQRWSMAVFYTLLDISTFNAYILYQMYEQTPKLERDIFLKKLARSLVIPLMIRRLQNGRIPKELRYCIERITGQSYPAPILHYNEDERLEKRVTCTLCPPRLRRKTQYQCRMCRRAICLQCAKKICSKCAQQR